MSEESSGDSYKTVKVPLKYCIKDPEINLPKINHYVLIMNSIVIHALQFMKLYILDGYNNRKIPDINKAFITCCLKTVSQKSGSGRSTTTNKNMMTDLKIFYDKHYKDISGEEKLPYTHMNTVFDYLSVNILTIYENNITQHFVEYVDRFVNVAFDKKEKIITANLSEENKRQQLQFLRNIKNDILTVDESSYVSPKNYHAWVNRQKSLIYNKKKFQKDSIHYDIKVSPFDYLPGMIYMMEEIEKKEVSMLNIFPLRNDVIPHHIRIDTASLGHMLIRKEHGRKQDYVNSGNCKKRENETWGLFFNTNLKCFKKSKYDFHHMIETDGVSCSIILKRKDLKSSYKPKTDKPSSELYIDEVKDYTVIKEKKIIAIDPGKSDLIYCVDNASKDTNVYRYTQDRRRKIGKSKRFNKLTLKMKR